MKVALYGCGKISRKHVAALDGIADCCAYDIDTEVTRKLSSDTGVPVYDSFKNLMENENPDVITILTPSGSHTRDILSLLRHKKTLVVEKPFGLNLHEIDECISECDKQGVKLFVVKQNRYNYPIVKLKRDIESGKLGEIVLGNATIRWKRDQEYYDSAYWRGTWAMDGGILSNQAIHHIDMLLYLLGNVDSVMGYSSRRLLNIETEDTCVAVMKFSSGALGVLDATVATRPDDLGSSITVLSEKASVEIGGFSMNDGYGVKTPEDFGFTHREFYKDVFNSINGDGSAVSGIDGRRSVEVAHAIYESIETKSEVRLRK